MTNIVRFFLQDGVTLIEKFEDVIVPQINSTVFLYDTCYTVEGIDYSYPCPENINDESILVDITIQEVED